MGKSIQDWMGISSEEYDAWMHNDELPKKKKNYKKKVEKGKYIV